MKLVSLLPAASAAALLALAALWLPSHHDPAGRAIPLEAPPALAASIITGTVLWKGTTDPAPDVRVVLQDQVQGIKVDEAMTDAQGVYTLTTGVGSWTVDVPSTASYWGYAQLVTAFPHDDYHLDFGITHRPPEPPAAAMIVAPTPGAGMAPGSTLPPAAPDTGSPATRPGKMPPAGVGMVPVLSAWLLALGVLLTVLGLAARRAPPREIRPAKAGR